ncbi:MAG TPA: glycoside hydrolase family 3 N-terminal domain-containing protein [Saprospiraceae bacterium]|nr:glycoside hydrolase family 3 N-terminal domain-containing protein [Saprospiraceae bacterium]
MPSFALMIRFLLLCIGCMAQMLAFAQPAPHFQSPPGPWGGHRDLQWVDSVFATLSDEARWAQLFMIRANIDTDTAAERQVDDLIRRYKPGGICFFNYSNTGTVEHQAELTNRYQASSDGLPLLVSLDAEWGLGMRLRTTTISFPRQIALGAIQDNRLIYEFGREAARQCRRVGVTVSFSPDIDINNNPANPVINERSFGEDRANVTAKGLQYMQGLQDGKVLACAKHFPGHGDTDVDSHYDLPLISHTRSRLDSLELYPFRALIQAGVGSVMVAHLQVPTLDARPNRPTTLSAAAITDLLRKEMGYEGLIFTDAMEMKGVSKHFPAPIADVEALRAGNDMVLLPADLGASITAVQQAVAEGSLDRQQLYASVKRVLLAKYRLGLTRPQRVDMNRLRQDLNSPQALLLKRRLFESAMTLVRDDAGMVGFPELDKTRIAVLSLGDTLRTVFQTYCGYYAPVGQFNAGKQLDSALQVRLLDTLRQYDVVLASIHGTRSKAVDKFGITDAQLNFLRRLSDVRPLGVIMFGNPYSMGRFDFAPTVLDAFTEDPIAQECAAQAMFGANDIRGKLPVTASPKARYGQGIERSFVQKRMGYTLPEAVGMSSDTLALLDELVKQMIEGGAAPGCQILVAKDGKVVWHRAYGYLTYEQTAPVTLDHLYDLASVTKVAATTVSAMRLYDLKRLALDTALWRYVPELRLSNKRDLTLREVLVHQAGLQAWIPFYQQTVSDKVPRAALYRRTAEPGFGIPVARDLWLKDSWRDTLWQQIFDSPLRETKAYKYSDLGLYLTARSILHVSGMGVDAFAEQQFYRPLGMSTATFRPWAKGWAERCVPTEEDGYFRQQRLQGYVHDMGAAMLGGVSGHAGLFSNANDLAKVFEMLLQEGAYGGRTYLQPETVRLFTTRHTGSTRRGIGFDMKELDPVASQNISPLASPRTFGHTGFTGIGVWVDPEQHLIFIFLSNRTYPTMDNGKLMSGDYRPKLQSIVYRAIRK